MGINNQGKRNNGVGMLNWLNYGTEWELSNVTFIGPGVGVEESIRFNGIMFT